MNESPAGVTVRSALSGDAAALAELDHMVNPSPWTASQLDGACGAQAEGTERALVVDRHGKPAGFVVYSRTLDEYCIHNIAVRPEWQGRGLGRQLLASVLGIARKAGAGRCHLEVRESNLTAIGLYQSLGFRPDGVRRNYYSTATGREHAVMMSKQLDQGC